MGTDAPGQDDRRLDTMFRSVVSNGNKQVKKTNEKLRYRRDSARCETAIRDHSRLSAVVPIDAAYIAH